jgi:hypothetical protein
MPTLYAVIDGSSEGGDTSALADASSPTSRTARP